MHPGAPVFDGTQICLQMSPDSFFPEDNDRAAISFAKRVCMGCHFRIECLEYALKDPSLYGIWGGTTVRQRQTLRNQKRAVA